MHRYVYDRNTLRRSYNLFRSKEPLTVIQAKN